MNSNEHKLGQVGFKRDNFINVGACWGQQDVSNVTNHKMKENENDSWKWVGVELKNKVL